MINQLILRVLQHAPHWLRDLIDWMLQRESPLLRWIKRRAARGIPVPEPVGPSPVAPTRVFFGPFNYAGQAWHWARSLEQADPRVSARNLAVSFPQGFGFESDDRVPAAVFAGSAEWQDAQRKAFERYTHVVIESFTSTLGEGRGAGLEREVRWHQHAGRRVALLCHGTDIRSHSALRGRSAHWPFDANDRASQRIERRVQENQRLIGRLKVPVFFSTPDLVHDVPEGEWLPLVVEAGRWERAAETAAAAGRRETPVVLHAPTSKEKGTFAVEKATAALGEKIEYRRLSGIPNREMPARIADADIVIDQLLVGSYGVAACEAMAAGRAVIGNIDDDVRETVRRAGGLDLPIIQADPDTLEAVLERLAADPVEISEAASRGPAFVRAIHTGSRTLPVLADFLGLDRE